MLHRRVFWHERIKDFAADSDATCRYCNYGSLQPLKQPNLSAEGILWFKTVRMKLLLEKLKCFFPSKVTGPMDHQQESKTSHCASLCFSVSLNPTQLFCGQKTSPLLPRFLVSQPHLLSVGPEWRRGYRQVIPGPSPARQTVPDLAARLATCGLEPKRRRHARHQLRPAVCSSQARPWLVLSNNKAARCQKSSIKPQQGGSITY